MSEWNPDVDLPELSVLELVVVRRGVEEGDIEAQDLWNAQIRWDAKNLWALDPDIRQDLCRLLLKLTHKQARELRGSDSYRLWEKISKDPSWLDDLMQK